MPTPLTSLLEAAVVQWQWLEQIEGLAHRDQFNWIHEELLNRFQFILTCKQD